VLFVAWQTGIALMMGLLWPEAPKTRAPEADAVPRRRIPIAAAIGIVAVAAPLVYEMVREVRGGALTRARAAMETERRMPSAKRLPPLPARPIDQVMILAPINTRTARPGESRRMLAGPTTPEYMQYSACYSPPGGDACKGSWVEVTEFPTPQWAKAGLRRIGRMADPDEIQPDEIAVEKFGHRLRQERVRPPDVLYYWWSGTSVVRVTGMNENVDDILRAYLSRYPSSLQR